MHLPVLDHRDILPLVLLPVGRAGMLAHASLGPAEPPPVLPLLSNLRQPLLACLRGQCVNDGTAAPE